MFESGFQAIDADTAGLNKKTARALVTIYDFRYSNKKAIKVEKGQGKVPQNTGYMTRNMFVQFNPESIRIDGNNENYIGTVAFNDKADNKQKKEETKTGSIYFSVSLIFDAVKNEDAFIKDQMALNPTTVARDLSKIGQTYEVQTQVEGFIAALQSEGCNGIAFTWGSGFYYGKLSRVDAEYTMFSPSGHPIRARVNLRIISEMSPDTETDMWDIRYAETFVKNNAVNGHGKSSTKNISSNHRASKLVGSILNI